MHHFRQLVDIGLKIQSGVVTTAVDQPLLDWLGKQMLMGKLSEAQKSTFIDQGLQLTLTVRPTAIAGDGIPFVSRGPDVAHGAT